MEHGAEEACIDCMEDEPLSPINLTEPPDGAAETVYMELPTAGEIEAVPFGRILTEPTAEAAEQRMEALKGVRTIPVVRGVAAEPNRPITLATSTARDGTAENILVEYQNSREPVPPGKPLSGPMDSYSASQQIDVNLSELSGERNERQTTEQPGSLNQPRASKLAKVKLFAKKSDAYLPPPVVRFNSVSEGKNC